MVIAMFVHTRSAPSCPPVILLGPPLSYLLALRTPSKDGLCVCVGGCVSCLQIECFYGQSLHRDFLPYDIDTIQTNLLLQLSCISASHVARRVQLPCLVDRAGTFSVGRDQPLFPPWRLHSPGGFSLGLWLIRQSIFSDANLGNCRFSRQISS
jgi:hypothetical protein